MHVYWIFRLQSVCMPPFVQSTHTPTTIEHKQQGHPHIQANTDDVFFRLSCEATFTFARVPPDVAFTENSSVFATLFHLIFRSVVFFFLPLSRSILCAAAAAAPHLPSICCIHHHHYYYRLVCANCEYIHFHRHRVAFYKYIFAVYVHNGAVVTGVRRRYRLRTVDSGIKVNKAKEKKKTKIFCSHSTKRMMKTNIQHIMWVLHENMCEHYIRIELSNTHIHLSEHCRRCLAGTFATFSVAIHERALRTEPSQENRPDSFRFVQCIAPWPTTRRPIFNRVIYLTYTHIFACSEHILLYLV